MTEVGLRLIIRDEMVKTFLEIAAASEKTVSGIDKVTSATERVEAAQLDAAAAAQALADRETDAAAAAQRLSEAQSKAAATSGDLAATEARVAAELKASEQAFREKAVALGISEKELKKVEAETKRLIAAEAKLVKEAERSATTTARQAEAAARLAQKRDEAAQKLAAAAQKEAAAEKALKAETARLTAVLSGLSQEQREAAAAFKTTEAAATSEAKALGLTSAQLKKVRADTKRAADAATKLAAEQKETAAAEKVLAAETKRVEAALSKLTQEEKDAALAFRKAELAIESEAKALGLSRAELKRHRAEQKKATEEAKKGGAGFLETARGAQALAVGVLAAATALVALAQRAADSVNTVNDMAVNLDFSANTMLGLEVKARDAGLELSNLEGILRGFSTKLDEARNGSEEALKQFERLGLGIGELEDFATVEEAFRVVVDRMGDLGSAAERNGIAAKLFSEEGVRLASVLGDGSAAIDEAVSRAAEFSRVIDGEAIGSAQAWQAATTDVRTAIDGLLQQLAQEFGPELRQGAKDLAELISTLADASDAVGVFVRVLGDLGKNAGLAGTVDNASEKFREMTSTVQEAAGTTRGALVAIALEALGLRDEYGELKATVIDFFENFDTHAREAAETAGGMALDALGIRDEYETLTTNITEGFDRLTESIADTVDEMEAFVSRIPGLERIAQLLRQVSSLSRRAGGESAGVSSGGAGVFDNDFANSTAPVKTEVKGEAREAKRLAAEQERAAKEAAAYAAALGEAQATLRSVAGELAAIPAEVRSDAAAAAGVPIALLEGQLAKLVAVTDPAALKEGVEQLSVSVGALVAESERLQEAASTAARKAFNAPLEALELELTTASDAVGPAFEKMLEAINTFADDLQAQIAAQAAKQSRRLSLLTGDASGVLEEGLTKTLGGLSERLLANGNTKLGNTLGDAAAGPIGAVLGALGSIGAGSGERATDKDGNFTEERVSSTAGARSGEAVAASVEAQAANMLNGIYGAVNFLIEHFPELAADIGLELLKVPFKLAATVFESLDGLFTKILGDLWEDVKEFFRELFPAEKIQSYVERKSQQYSEATGIPYNEIFGVGSSKRSAGRPGGRSVQEQIGALLGDRPPQLPGGVRPGRFLSPLAQSVVTQNDRLAAAGVEGGGFGGGGRPMVFNNYGITTRDAAREVSRRERRQRSSRGRNLGIDPFEGS